MSKLSDRIALLNPTHFLQTIKDTFSTHVSESGIDSIIFNNINYNINNNGTIEDLHRNTNDIMEKLNFVIKL